MRWAILLMGLAGVCAVVIVVRGVLVYDGLSLLAVAFVAASFLAAFLSHLADQRATHPVDRRYPR